MSIRICSTNLSVGSFQVEFPGVRIALQNSLDPSLGQFHRHESLLVLLNDELTKDPVQPPDLELILNPTDS